MTATYAHIHCIYTSFLAINTQVTGADPGFSEGGAAPQKLWGI